MLFVACLFVEEVNLMDMAKVVFADVLHKEDAVSRLWTVRG